MKKYFFLTAVVLSVFNFGIFQEGAHAAEPSRNIIEESIGYLVLSHSDKYSYKNDLNDFGAAILFDEFLKIYQTNIENLDLDKRIDFLWSAMWHLEFDGHYMEEFQKIVYLDCGESFIKRLEVYIQNESKLKRNGSRLYLSKKVLAGLKLLKSRSKK